MSDDGSDDSDEWGTADLPDLPVEPTTTKKDDEEAAVASHNNGGHDDHDDGWTKPLSPAHQPTPAVIEEVSAGEPMILVDMTILSQKQNLPEIHSRFDRNSVNDAEAVKRLRKSIEKEYSTYAKHTEYLSEGVVIPCGSSVWKDALPQLRDERPGHYFCPVFAPRRDCTN
jgi:hypothetical protein